MSPSSGNIPDLAADEKTLREELSRELQKQGSPPPRYEDVVVRTKGVGVWTLDKLQAVKDYAPALTVACTRARDIFYAEPFCGPGFNRIDDRLVKGTGLIALETQPPFTQCLLMDKSAKVVKSMSVVTRRFGERARVERGDCNVDFVKELYDLIGYWAPCLCVLDPEGTELHYTTLAEIGSLRRRRPVEQMILFPTHTGFLRMLNRDGNISVETIKRMHDMFGTDKWLDIYEQRVAERIDTDEATTQYVTLYADGLRRLGYHVRDREIRDRGHQGTLRYFLVFATGHELGDKIINSVFDSAIADRGLHTQPTLPGFEIKPERRRRLID